ncbi:MULTISPECIES: HD-GYP domain-containing protein [Methylobacterium]|uniref:HD-GYP domain-containing protein n=1 Tax=Methylobacterium TaxID=407 RepID=UPI00069FAFD9|nr:HD domain-containing phosphohydrolase [Methylobacterium variabile]
MVWRFDDATHQHCLLVAGLAAGFSLHLGLRRDDCRRLTEAALLHDVGKSRIPLAILNKPARLDGGELAAMRAHPVLGHELLRDAAYDEALLAVVRSHHELLDGSGYPDGLRGDEIPDMVRIVTICDIFGELIECRPYKPPISGEAAYTVLEGEGVSRRPRRSGPCGVPWSGPASSSSSNRAGSPGPARRNGRPAHGKSSVRGAAPDASRGPTDRPASGPPGAFATSASVRTRNPTTSSARWRTCVDGAAAEARGPRLGRRPARPGASCPFPPGAARDRSPVTPDVTAAMAQASRSPSRRSAFGQNPR